MKIVQLVLDVMSPAQQSIVDLVEILSKINNIAHVDITLSELEKNVEDLKVTLAGHGLDYEEIRGAINEFGGVIRNVDNVISSEQYVPKQDSDTLSASTLVLAYHLDSKNGNFEQICDEFDKTLKYLKSKEM